MLKFEGGAGLIIERQCYSLKEEYAEKLSALLDDLLDYHNVLKGYLIDNENNEYYTSREYLDIVKESYRLKQTKHLNANLDSNFSTTSQLTSSVAGAFFKCIASFVSENSDLALSVCGQTGKMQYPKNGYMGWHNNTRSGWRIYCSYCREQAKSYFRYENDNGDFVDCLENRGWNFRFFYTRDTASPFWHSVYTETERVSLGTFLGRDQDKIKNLLGDTV